MAEEHSSRVVVGCVHDIDEVVRQEVHLLGRRFGGTDVKAAVDLRGVGTDDPLLATSKASLVLPAPVGPEMTMTAVLVGGALC
jgi:hypothetical protein